MSEAGDPAFEVCGGGTLTYRVRKIATPPQDWALLAQYGEPPEKEQVKPHEIDHVGGEAVGPYQRREQESEFPKVTRRWGQ